MAFPRILNMLKSPHVNDIVLSGNFTIGSSGAVDSQTAVEQCGVTVTKTGSETGRYTLTYQRTFKSVKAACCNIVGPTDNAFPTTTGSDPQVRNMGTSSVDIQCKRTDTQADANPASGSLINFIIIVSKS